MQNTPTIVVIDDDAVTLKVLSVVLNSEEVDVRVAHDAKSGMQMIRNADPRLVILDVFMPGRNGLSVLNELKGDAETRNTPVLMLTSDPSFRDIADGLGADGYLTKPFSPVELRQKISDLLHA